MVNVINEITAAEGLSLLTQAVNKMEGLSPDGAQFRNDIGWSGADVLPGRFLASIAGKWNEAQVARAYRMLSRYRRTQLDELPWGELDRLFGGEQLAPEAARAVAAQFERTDGEAARILEGLRFSVERQVNTRQGVRFVSNAHPTEEFWALWRSRKEWVKERGLTLSKGDKGWQVTRWRKPNAGEAEVVHKPATVAEYRLLDLKDESGLFPYQIGPVKRLVASLRRHNAALDASDTGVGKTFQALAALREMGVDNALVVAPLSVQTSWKRAAAHFGLRIRVINYEKVRMKKSPYGSWRPGHGGKEIFTWQPDVTALVFDECHRCKSHKTKNGQLMAAAARQKITTIALSATSANNPLELKNLGFLLGLHQYRNFWSWACEFGAYPSKWGGYAFSGGQHHVAAIHKLVFPEKGNRTTTDELGDLMPENRVVGKAVEVANPAALDKAWQGALDEITDLGPGVLEVVRGIREASLDDTDHHLTALLRARQLSEALKIPAFVELSLDALAEGNSVVLFVNFKDSIDALKVAFAKAKIEVGVVDGDTSAEEKDRFIDAFQANRIRVMICNSQAGGEGISLHDLDGRHPRVSFISPTWSDRNFKQLLGRIPRAGGKSKCLQTILWAAGTVEESVLNALERKLSNLDSFNDGSLEPVRLLEQAA